MFEELEHLVEDVNFVIPRKENGENLPVAVCTLQIKGGAVITGVAKAGDRKNVDNTVLINEAKLKAMTKLSSYENYHQKRLKASPPAVAVEPVKEERLPSRAFVLTQITPRTDGIAVCMVDYPEVVGVAGTMMHARQTLYTNIVSFIHEKLDAGETVKTYPQEFLVDARSRATTYWVELPSNLVERIYKR